MRTRARARTAVALAAAAVISGLTLTGAGAASAARPTASPRAPAVTIHCGVFRWRVKTGSDADRLRVSGRTITTSIAYLSRQRAPSSFPDYYQDHRFSGGANVERHIWKITAQLVALKLEDDGDIHLRLRNASGQTMIAEMPLGSCVSSRSLWKTAIIAARSYITRRYHVSLSHWTYVDRTITLRGLGFFDEEHGVTGAAPNDVELHPVIQATFP